MNKKQFKNASTLIIAGCTFLLIMFCNLLDYTLEKTIIIFSVTGFLWLLFLNKIEKIYFKNQP